MEEILHSIHPRTPSSKIIPWLREDFVPYVLTVLPEGQVSLDFILRQSVLVKARNDHRK